MTDIAHRGHVEILTKRFDESLDFFTRVYGLTESGRDETSAYLRAWDDYEFHTLKLTRSEATGVGHIAYRASSEAALMRRIEAIEASAYKVIGWDPVVWTEADRKKGQAWRLKTIASFHTHGTPPVGEGDN